MSDEMIVAGADTEPGNIAAGDTPPAAKTPDQPAPAGKTPPEGKQPADGKESADPAGKWPENWRELLSAGDKKAMERLGRFATPSDIWKAQEEASRKISEGLKPLQKPGPKATEQEWADYRKSVGIPEKVDDYIKGIELPDGRQIGDDDKPVVAAFAERAMKAGIPSGDISHMVDEYYRLQEEEVAQQAEKDAEYKRENLQALKEEYGGDFKANMNAMRPYFDSFDEGLFDNLMGGRLADGSKIGNNASLIRFFVAKSLDENPAATILPAGGANLETIENEIKTLEKRMGEDRNAWFKDEAAQKRYQQLITARDKLAK